ncbi:MAG TPA: VOC family protein [Mycobacteriales bacterium]|jgi:predicted 3-demethylubiquinone-9 3-methyltransferase (glyoxalase superfamily)
MQRITPCLWFDTQAEDAATFYVSVFKNSRVTSTTPYSEAGPGTPGSAMLVEFELDGQPYTAINGGPEFTFSEAVSFQITCEGQAEVDYYWDALTADGGSEGPCGWLKDKFGLSWQVVPTRLGELASDPAKSAAVMQAMFGMKRIDIAELERAAASA